MHTLKYGSAKVWALAAVALLFTLGPNKCVETGGGYILTAEGDRISFGYSLQCILPDGVDPDECGIEGTEVRGQVQWNDRAEGVRFHAVIDQAFGACFSSDPEVGGGLYRGTYYPKPPSAGDAGTIEFCALDYGEPGVSSGDVVNIELIGGVYGGYSLDFEPIDGGNIQFQEIVTQPPEL